MDKSTQIKKIIFKIDLKKIAKYLKKYSASKTLKQIISHNKKAIKSNNDQEIFKMGVRTAYNLDTICDPNKANYVKNEQEKKYWLEISKELFENTIGVKEKVLNE